MAYFYDHKFHTPTLTTRPQEIFYFLISHVN